MTEGVVDIASNDQEAMQKAIEWIKSICAKPEVGEVYHGKVVSILDFGAFVEILPGKEGLLHVSEIAWGKTEHVEDVLKVGDEVDVKLLEYDEKNGKMRLSMRALTEKPEGYVDPAERRPRGGDRRNSDRRNSDRRGSDRRNSDRRDDQRNDDRRGKDRRDSRFSDDRHAERKDRRFSGRKPENAPAPSEDDFRDFSNSNDSGDELY